MQWTVNEVMFEIADEWWERAKMARFVPYDRTFRVLPHPDGQTVVVPIAEIEPVKRIPGTNGLNEYGFNEDRMLSILRGFCSKSALPALLIETSQGLYRYKLYDGFHRYYASFAAGFSHVPVIHRPLIL